MKYLKSITTILLCLFAVSNCYAQEEGIVEWANEDSYTVFSEDNVFMEGMTIAQIVMESNQFSVLEATLESASMLNRDQRGSYTLIAPIDEAWNEVLDVGDFEAWYAEHEATLKSILQYHIIQKPVTAADLADGLTYGSVLGSPLNFDVEEDGEINVNDHEVEFVIHASNGVIYVMSEVLMPEDISNDINE